MDAYYRLVTWVESQSFAELEHRAVKGLSFTDCTTTRAGTADSSWHLDIDVVRAKDLGADNRLKFRL